MTQQATKEVIAYLKRVRDGMLYTPYDFETEIKELNDLISKCEEPEIKLVPMGTMEREPKINELV